MISPAFDDETTLIRPWRSELSGEWVLFLPAGADLTALTVGTGADALLLSPTCCDPLHRRAGIPLPAGK